MRSPGLYWVGTVDLDWWLVEHPRDKERGGVVVSVDGMVWSRGVGCRRVIDDDIRER